MFIGKVEWKFWFIHLCRTITFEHFAVFNQTEFIVNCLRSGTSQSLSRTVVQAITLFGCFPRFTHKDFIASVRIFSLWNVPTLKTLRFIFGSKQKCRVNRHQVTHCKATCFTSPSYPLEKQLTASVFVTSRVLCAWRHLPYSTSNVFIRILKPLKKV